MRSLGGLRADRVVLAVALGVALARAVLLATAGAAGATDGSVVASPASAPITHLGAAAPAGSIVAVRPGRGPDSLWSIDPLTASATQLVALPPSYRPSARPSCVAVSPGAVRLAYLTFTLGPTVTVYDTQTGALSTWSLAARGVKYVDSLAWASSTRLLVAGRAGHRLSFFPVSDRIYSLNAVTGASHLFAGLSGTEPTVAPAVARLVYVHLRISGPVPRRYLPSWNRGAHWVVERLYSLRLVNGAKPRLIASARYISGPFVRRFQDPQLSPDGAYLMTLADDLPNLNPHYTVRSAVSGKARTTIALYSSDLLPTWSSRGDQVAFAGTQLDDRSRSVTLFVCSAPTRAMHHSAALDSTSATGLGWSSDGGSLAYSLQGRGEAEELFTVDPATLSLSTDLGSGSLPVFMP